ncbi:MAG TPA: serine hydrolase [bacterium]|nr:serine hydrolase [bacterium]HOG37890.1 serine hydrolase [bacterium]HQI03106.1 serine hydrolase [bacterium]
MQFLIIIPIILSILNTTSTNNVFVYPEIYKDNNKIFIKFIDNKDQNSFPKKLINDSLGVRVGAKSVLVKDLNTDKILFSKNKDEKRQIASITKLMSAIIIKDLNVDPEKLVEITSSDNVGDFSKTKISPGDKIKFKDLLSASLVVSSNSGMLCAIKNSDISEEEFVKKMNQKVEELNLKNTHFDDATGLSNKNVSTADEILKITKIAFSYPDIELETAQKKYSFTTDTGKTIEVKNTNELIGSYLDIKAGKTGYTEEAGYCLVSKVGYDNKGPILVVVLGSDSHFERFSDLKDVSSWVFNNYVWK